VYPSKTHLQGDFNFRFDIFLNGTLYALPTKISHATEADSISESNLKI